MSKINVEKMELNELLLMVDNGELKLPGFQRDYNWKIGKVKKLLDSIQKNHPAGSLLFLYIDESNPIINEDNFKYANDVCKKTKSLVLDGQQRLTSCYCVFYNKGEKTYYLDMKELFAQYQNNNLEILDLDDSNIIIVKKHNEYPEGGLSKGLLPMCYLKSRSLLKEKLSPYKKNLDRDSEYFDFIDEKLESYCDYFFDYEFPTVALPKELTLDAVCKVFQTINTTGLKLSAFDICVAKFMRYNIRLKERIDNAIDSHPDIKIIADKDKTIVLQTIALLDNKTAKMNQLANDLDDLSINKFWDKSINGLNATMELLTDFGVGCNKNLTLLPYQPYIPLFGAILAQIDFLQQNAINKSKISDKLKMFFYHTALSSRYNEGSDTKMKEDYSILLKWILNDEEPYYMVNGVDWNVNKVVMAKKGSAFGKIILCLINSQYPNDFYNSKLVGIGSKAKPSDIHHLFPKAKYSNKMMDSVFNCTFLTPETNKYIKDKSTAHYIKEITNNKPDGERKFTTKLRKHFIDDKAFQFLKNEEFDKFIYAREAFIREYIINVIGIKVNIIETNSDDDDSNDDAFLTDEIE